MNHHLSIAVVIGLSLSALSTAWAPPDREGTCQLAAVEQDRFNAPDGAPANEFGCAIALSGDTLIVGAQLDSEIGQYTGAAWIFRFINGDWVPEMKLVSPDADPWDQFGFSVAIDGDVAAVGCPADDELGDNSGTVTVFRNAGSFWYAEAVINADDADPNDLFGASIALEGSTLVIGCHPDVNGGVATGSVYVFEESGGTWTQSQKLLADSTTANSWFGRKVDLRGDRIAASAYLDGSSEPASGAVFIFERDQGIWAQSAEITPEAPQAGHFFGFDITLDDDALLVGALLEDSGDIDCGAAYIYSYSNNSWSLDAHLVPDDCVFGTEFGFSTSLEGDRAVIGSLYGDSVGGGGGAAYGFQRIDGEWMQVLKLEPKDLEAGDFFSHDLALEADTLVVTLVHDNIDGENSGSAIGYRIGPDCDGDGWPDPPCPGDLDSDGQVNVADLLAVIAWWGNPYDVNDLLIVISAWGPCP